MRCQNYLNVAENDFKKREAKQKVRSKTKEMRIKTKG